MKFLVLNLGICVFLISANVYCDDEEKAEEHYLKGKALVDEGAFEKAIVELEASYKLNPVPVVLYNIAVCYDELHQYADAGKYYRLFLSRGKEAPEEMREEVSARIKELNRYIGLLKLEVDVEKAEVLVDDKLVGHTPLGSIFVETGIHELVIRKTGYPDIKKKIKIVSGETTELSFMMKEPSDKEPEKLEIEEKEAEPWVGEVDVAGNGRKKLGIAAFWTVVGVTGAAALSMAITGSLAIKKDNEVAGMYEDEDWKSAADERDRLALGTNILLGITAAGAAASLVLFFFTDFKKEKRSDVLIRTGLDGRSLSLGYRREF